MTFLLCALDASILWGSAISVVALSLRVVITSVNSRYALMMSALVAMLVFPLCSALLQPKTLGTGFGSQSSIYSVVWIIGASIGLARVAIGLIQLQLILGRAIPLTSPEIKAAVTRLASALGLSRVPEIRVVQGLLSPCTIGVFKSAILLPASLLARLSTEQLEAILAHEMAHIRRWDYWLNLLQLVIESLLFYHPGVWIISHLARVDREMCCDDLALKVTGDRALYVRALSATAGLLNSPMAPASTGALALRMRRILGKSPRSHSSALASIAICLAIIPAVLAFSHRKAGVRFPHESLPASWKASAQIRQDNLIQIDFNAPGGDAKIVLTQPEEGGKTWFTVENLRFEGRREADGNIAFTRTDLG